REPGFVRLAERASACALGGARGRSPRRARAASRRAAPRRRRRLDSPPARLTPAGGRAFILPFFLSAHPELVEGRLARIRSRAALSAAFSIGTFGAAAGSAVAGSTLDRFGGAPVLGSAVLAGTVLLFVAASANSLLVFDLAWGLGTAAVGARGFYHVTMAL